MRKSGILLTILCVLTISSSVQAKTYLNTGVLNDVNNFEDFNTGVISCPANRSNTSIRNEKVSAVNMLSVDVTSGNLCSAIDKTTGMDGNETNALHYYVDGNSVGADMSLLLQARPDTTDTQWNTPCTGHYFVYKMKFLSGGNDCGYFKGTIGNLNGLATVDWSTGKAGWGYSANQVAFALDEWVTYTYILDKTGDTDVEYMYFDSSLGRVEFKNDLGKRLVVKNSSPRWLASSGWICGGSTKPMNPSLYIDDIEYYMTDYNVTCKNDGLTGVEIENKIELNVEGDIDESTINDILVFDETSNVNVSSIDYNEDVITINLVDKLADFTKYSVDASCIRGIDGIKKDIPVFSFTTTGKIVLDGEVKASKIVNNSPVEKTKLESGIMEATFNLTNNTEENLDNAVVCAMLVNGDKTEALAYKNVSIEKGKNKSVTFGFKVTDENSKIEIITKNSLNGNVYFSDIYTIDKNGISNKEAVESEVKYPMIANAEGASDGVSFYKLTLGESGSRENATEPNGLIECASKLTKSGNAKLISVKKSDNKLTGLVYCVRESEDDVLYTAINASKENGDSVEAFVWDSLLGNIGYTDKYTLK